MVLEAAIKEGSVEIGTDGAHMIGPDLLMRLAAVAEGAPNRDDFSLVLRVVVEPRVALGFGSEVLNYISRTLGPKVASVPRPIRRVGPLPVTRLDTNDAVLACAMVRAGMLPMLRELRCESRPKQTKHLLKALIQRDTMDGFGRRELSLDLATPLRMLKDGKREIRGIYGLNVFRALAERYDIVGLSLSENHCIGLGERAPEFLAACPNLRSLGYHLPCFDIETESVLSLRGLERLDVTTRVGGYCRSKLAAAVLASANTLKHLSITVEGNIGRPARIVFLNE